MTTNPFARATRQQAKARVAIDGPSGAGKTWTALQWATILAGPEPVAVIDTEHGSASLYADQFTFDTLNWAPPYDPNKLADILPTVATHGYGAVVIDSLSHFWQGEGGTLDLADAAGARAKGNSFAGWKVATPAFRALVDTILAAPLHVLVTMRTKTEWVLEEDSRGKKVPRRIGMAPVMRDGIEYEFQVVAELDLEHRFVVTKSRCSILADAVIMPGKSADPARAFAEWLSGGEPAPVVDPADVAVPKTAAMTELLDACRGRKDLAKSLWNGREGATRGELDGLIHAAVTTPDDADDTVVDEFPPPADGEDQYAEPASESPAVDVEHNNRRQWALIADAFPRLEDGERDARRKTLIDIVSAHRTQSSKELTAGEWDALFATLEAIKDGSKELHLHTDGRWTMRQRPGKSEAAA